MPSRKSKKPSGTRAEQLLEETVFFVDRSLGRSIGETLRAARMRIELHDDHFEEDAPDEEWLATVGARGWVVLTKDQAIRRKPQELAAVIAAKCRLFTLSSGSMTGQEMAASYLENRFKMARFLKNHSGPFVAVVSRTEVVLVAPKPPSPDEPSTPQR